MKDCDLAEEGGNSSPQATVAKKRTRHFCDSCSYSAAKKCNLKRHKENHSCKETFQCPLCTYSSKWRGRTVQHLNKHHLETANSSQHLPIVENKVAKGREVKKDGKRVSNSARGKAFHLRQHFPKDWLGRRFIAFFFWVRNQNLIKVRPAYAVTRATILPRSAQT